MRSDRFTRSPQALSREQVKLDTIALIPASLLPYKEYWQQVANDLPDGATLVVLPSLAKQQRIARSVAVQLRGKGKHVRVMDKTHCQSVLRVLSN